MVKPLIQGSNHAVQCLSNKYFKILFYLFYKSYSTEPNNQLFLSATKDE